MVHVMLDLETMGTSASAPIVAIGAVEFSLDEGGELGRTFYAAVDLQSAIDSGAVIDAATVMWWLQQSDQARAAIQRDTLGLCVALQHFSNWLREDFDGLIWGNGPSFDCTVLAESYRRLHLPLPWKFWNERCVRTYRDLGPDVPRPFAGTKHHALDDAKAQAAHLMAIARAFRG